MKVSRERKIKEKRNYKDGKLEGQYLYFYNNGKLWIKNHYKKGLLHGDREVYFKDGKLEKKEKYKNGFNLTKSLH